METIFGTAVALMDDGVDFSYSTIVRSSGSTPRKAGSIMLVLPERIFGTIGGGSSELETIIKVRESVLPEKRSCLQSFDMSGSATEDKSLICGGDCDVLSVYIDHEDASARKVFAAAHQAMVDSKNMTIYCICNERDSAGMKAELAVFVDGSDDIVGDFEGIGVLSRKLLTNPIRVGIHAADEDGISIYSDNIVSDGEIFIFGAGHVSKEVAFLAVHLGYQVTVLDDRADYVNEDNIPDCNLILLDDYKHVPELPLNDKSIIIIATPGHANDRTALEWAVDKPFHYLGMIGSKSKRKAVYGILRDGGVTDEQLEKVHSPIGLMIGAQTPQEIAVSIMAEIISCK